MPDSINQQLLDQLIRHAVYLERYKAGAVKRMLALLARSDASLRAQLAERILAIETRGLDAGPVTTQRLEQLIAAILQERADNMAVLGQSLQSELVALAEYETPFLVSRLETTLPADIQALVSLVTPSPQQVYAAALARPFQGKLLREALDQFTAADAARFRDTIRQGFATGQTTGQIVRNLFGPFGSLIGTRRNLQAVTRTALQHTAMVARQRVGAENASVIKAVKFVATLDSRTTPICRALDGETWPMDSSKIRWPPVHWQCRSTISYVTKSWREMGIDADELSPGTRASQDGQVPEDMTYGAWLKRQPVSVQNEVLGEAKARLFRDGGLEIDRFVEIRTGREYTLDELRARESDVWRDVFGNTA